MNRVKRWFGRPRSQKAEPFDQQPGNAAASSDFSTEPISGFETAIFAGGCFWCMVSPFDELPGIVSVVSGYTGGHTDNPTYDEVASETTGHAEAVQIVFDPRIFPYTRLLDLFWRQIDPTDAGGQFQDRGASYRTAIFATSERQRQEAEASKRSLQKSGRFKQKIMTEIADAGPFYPAEDEHQDYYKRSFGHYRLYRQHSGRDTFIHDHWDTDRDRERLRQQLTEIEYKVMIRGDMEPAFDNAYWNETRPGIYVDRLSGDPLFDASDKYDAGDGWPAFSKTSGSRLVKREAFLGGGTEVRTALVSRLTGIKLGYLLYDGPDDERLHYRVNSSALLFVPQDETN